MGKVISNNGNYDIAGGAYDDENNITWVRVKNTRTFGYGESMDDYVCRGIYNREDIEKRTGELQQKHPEFKFIPQIYWDIKSENMMNETLTDEGVADKYAEKQFNITDPNTAMDQRAVAAMPKDNSMGELLVNFEVYNYGEYINEKIFLNPKSLQNFDGDVKAISTRDGDLIVAQSNLPIYHADIMGEVQHAGIYAKPLYGAYDEEYNTTWHRIGKTDEFGWSISYKIFGENPRNADKVRQMIDVVERENPNYTFTPQYWHDIKSGTPPKPWVDDEHHNDDENNHRESNSQNTHSGMGEGVADKAAEKLFNIPDPNTAMDQKAIQGIPADISMGELVGEIKAYKDTVLRVFINPTNLSKFEVDVKAISNTAGDLFVAEMNLNIYHSEIINAINTSDIYPHTMYGAYDEEYNVTWHRLGKSDEFGWSVSYRDFGRNPNNYPKAIEMMNAVKRKNPQYTFYRRYWQEILRQRYDDKHNVNNDSLLNYESVVREEVENFSQANSGGDGYTITNDKNLDRIKDGFMPGLKKEFEQQQQMAEGYNDDKGIIKLYHRISGKNMKLNEVIKSVMSKGLITNDNGEVGSAIWFSDNFKDYGEQGKFVVSLEFDTASNGVSNNEFEIVYDGHNAYAYKNIPFDRLEVEKIPVGIINGNYIQTNIDMIENIGKGHIKAENVNMGFNLLIFEDIFKMYVEPFINVPDFLQQLDRTKIKMINIL